MEDSEFSYHNVTFLLVFVHSNYALVQVLKHLTQLSFKSTIVITFVNAIALIIVLLQSPNFNISIFGRF